MLMKEKLFLCGKSKNLNYFHLLQDYISLSVLLLVNICTMKMEKEIISVNVKIVGYLKIVIVKNSNVGI
jgi:hypothetical protein